MRSDILRRDIVTKCHKHCSLILRHRRMLMNKFLNDALINVHIRSLRLFRADWRRWTWTAPGGGRGDTRAGPEPLTPTQHKLHSGSGPRLQSQHRDITSQHGLRSSDHKLGCGKEHVMCLLHKTNCLHASIFLLSCYKSVVSV